MEVKKIQVWFKTEVLLVLLNTYKKRCKLFNINVSEIKQTAKTVEKKPTVGYHVMQSKRLPFM